MTELLDHAESVAFAALAAVFEEGSEDGRRALPSASCGPEPRRGLYEPAQLAPYELTHVRASPGDCAAGLAQAARKIREL